MKFIFSRNQKLSTRFTFKSIGDNLIGCCFFNLRDICKKSNFSLGFFTSLLKNKKAATLKLSPIDLKVNFGTTVITQKKNFITHIPL